MTRVSYWRFVETVPQRVSPDFCWQWPCHNHAWTKKEKEKNDFCKIMNINLNILKLIWRCRLEKTTCYQRLKINVYVTIKGNLWVKKSNREVQSWTKCWQRETTVEKSLTTHLIRTSAIRNPIPDPPPVIKATWSLQTHKNKSLSLCIYICILNNAGISNAKKWKLQCLLCLHEQIRAVDMCVCAHAFISLNVLWWIIDQLRFLCHDPSK